jgi:hypothetical protein
MNDIEVILRGKIVLRNFSVQIDKSIGTSGNAELIANIWYSDGDLIRSTLFCNEIQELPTDNEICRVTEECGLKWTGCINVCTDAASTMTGDVRGFVVKVQERNPEIRLGHSFLNSLGTVCLDFAWCSENMMHEVVRIAWSNAAVHCQWVHWDVPNAALALL